MILGRIVRRTLSKGLNVLKKAIAIITLPVLVGALAHVWRGEDAKAEPVPVIGVSIYDADPQHLWNRLHHALHVRTDTDGREVGADRLDPLLWENTRYLLSGKSHEDAVAVLDEFLSRRGEQLFSDPLRRAILQRDLWAVFDWAAAGDRVNGVEARSRILIRLAAAIDRVALTKDQIQHLPDNIAVAVASKSFAAGYDRLHPQAEFLPADLLKADGPWVCLKANDGRVITPAHDRAFGGRSVFMVLLRLPGDRKATLDYLTKLRRFPNPWTFDPKDVNARLHPHVSGPPVLNPELPQFPEGTEVALVRRAILVDDQGDLVATRLAETVQIRHFRKVPGPHDAFAPRDDQDVYELQLSRAKLFACDAGGLFSPDTDFLFVQFQGMGIDEFERADRSSARKLQRLVRDSCYQCHSAPGIFSVQSVQASFAERGQGRVKLAQCQLDDAATDAVYRKRTQRSWGLLQGLRIAARANPQVVAP